MKRGHPTPSNQYNQGTTEIKNEQEHQAAKWYHLITRYHKNRSNNEKFKSNTKRRIEMICEAGNQTIKPP